MIWAPGMVLNQTLPGPPWAEFQSTSGVPPGGVTSWIAVLDMSGAGAAGQRKTLKLPSEPYTAGGRGTAVEFVVGGRLSGSRNQAKKTFGPLAPEPTGAGRKENNLNWLSCSRNGSSRTSGPVPSTS